MEKTATGPGSGKVLVQAVELPEYTKTVGASNLDSSRYEITGAIRPTDIDRLSELANSRLER